MAMNGRSHKNEKCQMCSPNVARECKMRRMEAKKFYENSFGLNGKECELSEMMKRANFWQE